MHWSSSRKTPPRLPLKPTLFLFRSKRQDNLNAFALDAAGSMLPEKFGPWLALETISGDRQLPHGLSKKAALAACQDQGFALWRLKTAETPK
ncbi:MAG: hypothetical protein IOC90_04825 [Methylocystis sp.]|nr:hypothetical protein [Methylocystis sp.]MCA3583017.1 hypothetical protein [Methylocystis sp.]MCA3587340.1 hypothetical protein [Methylocystis sp.]MCA3590422.1 hypothetical protein [Methylocystis sp.]